MMKSKNNIEKLIKQYLDLYDKSDTCPDCMSKKLDTPKCIAHELETALHDFELSEKLLNEAYFNCLNAVSKRSKK